MIGRILHKANQEMKWKLKVKSTDAEIAKYTIILLKFNLMVGSNSSKRIIINFMLIINVISQQITSEYIFYVQYYLFIFKF